jgi:hypothetical protein
MAGSVTAMHDERERHDMGNVSSIFHAAAALQYRSMGLHLL